MIYGIYSNLYSTKRKKCLGQKLLFYQNKLKKFVLKWMEISQFFNLNPFLGVVCSSVRNKEVQVAESYSVKMIEIIEEYINSMGNQYSLISNIHISVMYFIMKQFDRAKSLFDEILQQELEYVNNDKSHPFLEQIYLHLALMYQSLKQHNSALLMWRLLLKVHRKQFSFSISSSYSNRSEKSGASERMAEWYNNYISTDYYNIGKWNLQLNDTQKALFNVRLNI